MCGSALHRRHLEPAVHPGSCAKRLSCHQCRYADRLAGAHDAEHLGKFEELLEAAIDLDRIPDEYLIAATYDPQLQVRASARTPNPSVLLRARPLHSTFAFLLTGVRLPSQKGNHSQPDALT